MKMKIAYLKIKCKITEQKKNHRNKLEMVVVVGGRNTKATTITTYNEIKQNEQN